VRRADHANALGRHDEALRLASQVLAGDPTHHGASVAAGIALLSTGRVAQGIEMLRAAVAAHPDSAEVLRLLSCGYVRSGQSTWALRSARAAVALEPWEPMARCQLSEALVASGDRLAAIHEGERAVELAPHQAQAHLTLAGPSIRREPPPTSTSTGQSNTCAGLWNRAG
jgi:Flp pilus assembly protein TadD